MRIGEIIVLMVGGLWSVAGAVFNWPWFVNTAPWGQIAVYSKKQSGWHGGRVFWLLIGLVLVVIGLIGIIGRIFAAHTHP